MLEQTQDEQEIIDRVAALDIGKAELVCCVRVPDPTGGPRRVQEVTTYSTMTRSLQVMVEAVDGSGRDPGRDGSSFLVLETTVLPVGGARVADLAGQRRAYAQPARA
jgi:hypothetical protein